MVWCAVSFQLPSAAKISHEETHRLLLTLHIAVGMLSTVLRIDELCVNCRWVSITDNEVRFNRLPTSKTHRLCFPSTTSICSIGLFKRISTPISSMSRPIA